MEPTLTQSGALYLAQHKVEKRRSAFFRRMDAAAKKETPRLITLGKLSGVARFNPDNGR